MRSDRPWMQCNVLQRARLLRLFDRFERASLTHVIPRGHRDLPNRYPGSDLDVFVEAPDFEMAVEAGREAGFETAGSPVGNAGRLLRRVADRPGRAIQFLVESPEVVPSYLRRELRPGEPTGRGRRERHLQSDGLDVHLFNHLAYKSPMNGARIRVDPRLEDWMFDRSDPGAIGRVPAPPDELVHLVSRGVFDYEGSFPGYYRDRCDDLVSEVTGRPNADDALREALDATFFAAGPLVYEHLRAGRYDEIRPALFRFADY